RTAFARVVLSIGFCSYWRNFRMPDQISRRETLRRGLAATSLMALLKDLPVPALAQGETDVPFTDLPNNFNPAGVPGAASRQLDISNIDDFFRPRLHFFTTQHFTKPEIDPAKYRLKFTEMLNKPAEFPLAYLKAMKS